MHKSCGESDTAIWGLFTSISMALNYCRPSGLLCLILHLLLVRYTITHNFLDIRQMLDPRDPMSGRFHYRAQTRDRREVRLVCLTHGRSCGTEKIKLYSSVIALSTIYPADRFPKKVMSHANLGDFENEKLLVSVNFAAAVPNGVCKAVGVRLAFSADPMHETVLHGHRYLTGSELRFVF